MEREETSALYEVFHESYDTNLLRAFGYEVGMPRMRGFLKSNGPWNQLVQDRHITLQELASDRAVALNDRLTLTPLLVPHRDEFSETVGFHLQGPQKSILYLPDIDKWERWHRLIEDELARVDAAYLDGTFFADGELASCDMSTIPHPFITESMTRFAPLPADERDKVRFIHLNHTNPALDPASPEAHTIREAGLHTAREGELVVL